MNLFPKGCRMGITLRTALWCWGITLLTLLIFATAIIPEQERTFQRNLESKAHGIAVALRDIAAGAVVNEDFGTVVDHCKEILQGDPSLEYLVVTKNDGYSLVNTRKGWRVEPKLAEDWRPSSRRATSGIGAAPPLDTRVFHYSQPFDYSGIQWGWIHVGLTLKDYDESVSNAYRHTGLIALECMLLSLLASGLYARFLVRPILDLHGVVKRVASGDLTARAQLGRSDELGTLASSVNSMTEALLRRDRTLVEANELLEHRVLQRTKQLQAQVAAKDRARAELAEAQQELFTASRQAGMAEVATGVLHNVGNVLNSVNVCVNLMSENLDHSQLNNLAKLSGLLDSHREDFPQFVTSDPRGKRIPEFVVHLTAALQEEQAAFAKELRSLQSNIAHIKEIVATQQNYAKLGGLNEDLRVSDLIEDALRINETVFLRDNVQVRREFSEVPLVRVDRHKVLLILVNLFTNAKYAMTASGQTERQLTIRVSRSGSGSVAVAVQDNGMGIAPENLTRVFSHGFTTKKRGHGFGLHSGALAAKEMGGSLKAYSDGPGKGATFVLDLPVAEDISAQEETSHE